MFIDPWGLSAENILHLQQLFQGASTSEERWQIQADLLIAIINFEPLASFEFFFRDTMLTSYFNSFQITDILATYILYKSRPSVIVQYFRNLGFNDNDSLRLTSATHWAYVASFAGTNRENFMAGLVAGSMLDMASLPAGAAGQIQSTGTTSLNEIFQESGRVGNRSGFSRAPKHSILLRNSIYEQMHHDGTVRSRTFYDGNGHSWLRQDFMGRPHGGIMPHQHILFFNSQGQAISREIVSSVPPWFNNLPMIGR